MIALVRFAYLATEGIWQVQYDLPLLGIRGIKSTQPANSETQARAQAAMALRAKGFLVFVC